MKHKLINELIKSKGYESYLEIGYGHGFNFRQINCKNKLAIDPVLSHAKYNVRKMRSDEFFKVNVEKYDVIFIDGLHHADQVRKDINNASRCLTKRGCILLHDTIPPNEKAQNVPREQLQWTGDVWRAVVGLRGTGVDIVTKRADYGLTYIFPDGKVFEGEYEEMQMPYEDFAKNIESALCVR